MLRDLAPPADSVVPARDAWVDTPGRYGQYDPWLDYRAEEREPLNLTHYWLILVKRRWLIAAIIVSAIALGVGATLLMTPIYRAETTLQIDRETARIINVEGVEPAERSTVGDEFFQTQYGLIKSRSLATRVVDKLGLAANDDFLRRMGVEPPATGSPANRLALRREIATSIVQGNIAVAPVRGSRLVRITFDSPDPTTAATIANATAENFIASNLDRRFESSSYARQFLEERLAQVKAKLEETERQLVAYATNQQIINIPMGTGENGAPGPTQSLTASSLVALNSALSEARAERIKAEQRYRQSQANQGLYLPEVLQNPSVQELTQTRAKAAAEYQDKLRVFKPDFPEMTQLQARINELDRQIQAEAGNVRTSLRTNYEVALAQERSFEGQVNQLKNSMLNLRDRSIQYEILQREVDTNRQLYEGLLQRYKEIGVVGGVQTNNISIVDRAEVPGAPAKPNAILNVGLAGIIGFVLALAIAWLLELLDESVSRPEDVETKIGLTLIGSVPMLFRETPQQALEDIRSAFSEAYYSIRTSLQFSTAEGAPSTLLVTSARPSEGKSTTAFAVAKNFARLGIRVLLVDGDLRNPSMHRTLGVDNSRGFSNYLTMSGPLHDLVQETQHAHLTFLPCGPLPPNPAELLSGPRLKAFIQEARKTFDMIVIDGPPVLGLADAPVLASSTAGTLFVIESRGTRRTLAKTAIRRLRVGNARILGAVLTKFNAKKASYGAGYAYAYDYNYGDKPQIANDLNR